MVTRVQLDRLSVRIERLAALVDPDAGEIKVSEVLGCSVMTAGILSPCAVVMANSSIQRRSIG